MGTLGLNGVQILVRVEVMIDEEIATFLVIEIHEQPPVDQPGPLLQRLKRIGGGCILINDISEPLQIFKRWFPALTQNLTG
jgi:hypothetical protein